MTIRHQMKTKFACFIWVKLKQKPNKLAEDGHQSVIKPTNTFRMFFDGKPEKQGF